MNHCVKVGLVVTNLLLVVLLCLYIAVPSRIIERFTSTEDDDHLRPASRKPLQRELKLLHHQSPKKTKSKINMDAEDLPQSVIDGVKTFVFFLGHARSGHSIVGSLIDSHPHMVISHEFDLFGSLSSQSLAATKPEIFNALWKNTEMAVNNGLRTESEIGKGYSLSVDGLYQGRYVDHIDVIGDKQGGTTTKMLLRSPDKWSYAFNIIKSLAGNLKVIHVIRNPYDNIATSIMYAFTGKHKFGEVKRNNDTDQINSRVTPKLIEVKIKAYFSFLRAIVDAEKRYNLDVIEIHGKDLISDPRGTLLKMCNDLGVTCSDNYLEMCGNKIYKTESRTRYMIKWADEHIQKVEQNIKNYTSLKGYTFYSP